LHREGHLYISEFTRNRVLLVDPSGALVVVAGTQRAGFSGDGGPAADAEPDAPSVLAFDPLGELTIADHYNNGSA